MLCHGVVSKKKNDLSYGVLVINIQAYATRSPNIEIASIACRPHLVTISKWLVHLIQHYVSRDENLPTDVQ